MNKVKANLLAAAGIFMVMGTAHAGFGERAWSFKPGETVIVDYTHSFEHTGSEYACTSFTPSKVSFSIKYEEPYGLKPEFLLKADPSAKITHDKARHTYYVKQAQSLDFGFPYGGKYYVTNTTGTTVRGHYCDTGVWG